MIDVETTAPVFSYADGNTKKEFKTDRKSVRALRKVGRKAKRNARKLKRVKLRNGKTAMVYVLTRLKPVKKSGADESLSIQYVKTYPDNTTSVVLAEDVVKTTDGKFFDKNEVAKAFGVEKSAVTQQMIDRYIIPVAPTTEASPTTTEVQKSPTSDAGVIVPEEKVVMDEDGNPYVSDDLKADGEILGSDDVKEDDKKAQGGMTKNQKIVLWVGVGLAVVIIGVVVYRKMSSNKGK